jgi:hypothetical protein
MVIAPPDGDLTNPDISPVEAIASATELGTWLSVRMVLDPGDLEQLAAGGVVWLSFMGGAMPPFAVAVTEP